MPLNKIKSPQNFSQLCIRNDGMFMFRDCFSPEAKNVCGIKSFELLCHLSDLTNILCRSIEIILTLPLDYELQVSEISLFCFQLPP